MPNPSDIAFVVVRPLAWLAIPLSVAVAASMLNSPGIRGIRNIAIASCYLLLPVGVVLHGWSAVGGAWVLLSLTSGFSYWGYEMLSRVAAVPDQEAGSLLPRPYSMVSSHGRSCCRR